MPALIRLAVWMRAKDLHEHGLDAQIQRRQRRVFTGGALTVVGAADDDAAALRLAAGRESPGRTRMKQ